MSTSVYRHDNSATTEQRVAQILSEAKAAMKAAEDSRVKVPSSYFQTCVQFLTSERKTCNRHAYNF
jgi:hypothetical protein